MLGGEAGGQGMGKIDMNRVIKNEQIFRRMSLELNHSIESIRAFHP
jgi:hypothetical protein